MQFRVSGWIDKINDNGMISISLKNTYLIKKFNLFERIVT